METYKIVVLGASGSGKTVFLASLYKQLFAQRDDFGFHLAINTRQKQELVRKYEQIASLDKEWPASTDRSQNTSWTFTCCVQDDELRVYALIDFEYLDYAGENITDPLSGQGTEDLDKAVEKADVLLCLLDGHKVLALMQKQEIGYQLIREDLPNIIPYLQKTGKPVHFVLTKWDLFLNDEYYMQQGACDLLKPVRDFLLRTDEPLRSIVYKRARKNPVRLIPISAVGKDFARLEDSKMKKVGENPKPLLVEMPLICVLFDVFKVRREQLRQEAMRVQGYSVKSSSRFGSFVIGWFVRVFVRIAVVIAATRKTPGPLSPMIDIIVAVADNIAERLERKAEAWEKMDLQELEKQKEEALQAIQDEESALESTLNCFHFQFRKLQETFPSSDFDRA